MTFEAIKNTDHLLFCSAISDDVNNFIRNDNMQDVRSSIDNTRHRMGGILQIFKCATQREDVASDAVSAPRSIYIYPVARISAQPFSLYLRWRGYLCHHSPYA